VKLIWSLQSGLVSQATARHDGILQAGLQVSAAVPVCTTHAEQCQACESVNPVSCGAVSCVALATAITGFLEKASSPMQLAGQL
jgi:hypothetical protein